MPGEGRDEYEERRKLKGLFLLLAFILLLSTAWAVWDEAVTRRPWKVYQRQYYRLAYEALKDELRRAEDRFESPQTQAVHRDLLSRIREAKAGLDRPETRAQLERLKGELAAAERAVSDRQLELQITKGELLELEYEYGRTGSQEIAGRIARLKERAEETHRLIMSLTRDRDALKEKVDTLLSPVDRLQKEVERSTAPLKQLERSLAEARNRKPEVKQVLIQSFERNVFGEAVQKVDRCISCHLELPGENDGRVPDLFRPHPERDLLFGRHPPERFGCTICHEGQGVGLTVTDAHGHVEDWQWPLLPLSVVESSCGKCHREDRPLQGAPSFSRGLGLFKGLGCAGCHKAEGREAEEKIGPELSRVGLKVKPGWLIDWLKDPKAYLPRTRMPNFGLSDKEARAIAAYLLSLAPERERLKRAQAPSPAAVSDEVYERGQALFRESRCVTCHAVEGKGGTIAPDLARIGEKVYPEWLVTFLRNPRGYLPASRMPRYRFTEEEGAALASYLLTEYRGSAKGGEESPVERPLVDEGMKLVRHYGCFGCHEIRGLTGAVTVGPDLSDFGNKRLTELDFGSARGIPPTARGWLKAKLKSPRVFRDTLKMPDYRLSDREIEDLSTFILGLRIETIAREFVPSPKPASDYVPPGRFGDLVRELNCLVCHRIKGRGGELAPDLTREGSQVKGRWLREFLMNPDVIRPALVERMPRFRLKAEEAELLAGYIEQNLVNEKIDSTTPVPPSPGPGSRGKRLYDSYGCRGCHQIELSGGSIGPNLTEVGRRLRPGWIYRWLKEPQGYKPGGMEPEQGLTDNETRALTAYLTTLD